MRVLPPLLVLAVGCANRSVRSLVGVVACAVGFAACLAACLAAVLRSRRRRAVECALQLLTRPSQEDMPLRPPSERRMLEDVDEPEEAHGVPELAQSADEQPARLLRMFSPSDEAVCSEASVLSVYIGDEEDGLREASRRRSKAFEGGK
mmetsp:Transcript_23122/g.54103  ORF Transcript_23122/g.54103 Transcript_23122/m.54103 type:complete len:149 (-) Transcript_23122:140-586(-)